MKKTLKNLAKKNSVAEELVALENQVISAVNQIISIKWRNLI